MRLKGKRASLLNTIEVRVGSQVKRMFAKGRGGHQSAFQRIFRQALELGARLNDDRGGISSKKVNSSLRGEW
jgi:glutamyl-tRNA reductase